MTDRRRISGMALIALLATSALAAATPDSTHFTAQTPPPAGGKPAEEEKKPPEPIVDTDAEASRQLSQAEKGLKATEPRLRAQAIEPFLTRRNESYVKRLAAMLKDSNEDVAKLAAKALRNQPFPKCTDALLDFACNPKNWASTPEIVAEAIRALAGPGLGKRGYARLRELFDDADTVVQTAIWQTLGAAKEKKAFSFFVDNFDLPQPVNVNDPNNPPEDYWRERVDAWNAWKQYVRQGMKELTGESFSTGKQYIEWASGPGKALGFVYSKGS